MKILSKSLVLSTAFLINSLASANIEVNFIESAPKDSFVILNTGDQKFENIQFELDLSTSAGNLIFDTTASGKGVEVFQPFELKQGQITLSEQKHQGKVADGEQLLVVEIKQLNPNETVSFTIDVDDQLTNSSLGQIRVAGSEMAGAVISITTSGETLTGTFNDKNIAKLN